MTVGQVITLHVAQQIIVHYADLIQLPQSGLPMRELIHLIIRTGNILNNLYLVMN